MIQSLSCEDEERKADEEDRMPEARREEESG